MDGPRFAPPTEPRRKSSETSGPGRFNGDPAEESDLGATVITTLPSQATLGTGCSGCIVDSRNPELPPETIRSTEAMIPRLANPSIK